jgi:hypothetical protein
MRWRTACGTAMRPQSTSVFSRSASPPGGRASSGCVGSLEARVPLVQQVANSAYDAAFCDQRLSPVQADELRELTIEISILSALSDVPATSESELLGSLRPGIDGVVLYDGERRATFLPKVWEVIELPFDFLEHLRRKAGLPNRYWSPTLRFQRYTADCFGIAIADLDKCTEYR